ncbi:MAG TPA: tetratricopeptide repeat protein, partial [Terricaulis sp.]|nr:tetratricopeptide repeat protein [Terricaulis sp.]
MRAQARRAHVSEAALIAAAEVAGANFARSGRFDALSLQQTIFEALAQQADQIAELQQRLDALTEDADPATAAIFAAARATLDEGRLADADSLLAQVAERDLAAILAADAEVEHRRLRAGETVASRGQVAFVRADYLAAADHYGRAAETVPQAATEQRWQYRILQTDALYVRGELFAEPEALREAVRLYRESIFPLAPRSSAPGRWGPTQNNLGLALKVLGERGDSTALRGAVTAFRAALEVLTRTAAPAEWSSVQNNLGAALLVLGQRGDDAALIGAEEAFRRALDVRTRDAAPADWAATQNNLGIALKERGERGDVAALREATAAYRAALQVRTRDAAPADWAETQNNLGAALLVLGRRGDDAALIEAEEAFRRALDVRTRD